MRQFGRSVLSYLPRAGVLPHPSSYRPAGISAMMTIKDEEDWVEKSILSIVDYVDEIVAVDNGSEDGTFSTLERLQRALGEKLHVFTFPREDFCAAVNFTLSKTRYRWILRWH